MIHRLREFLESTFRRTVTIERLEQAIRDANTKSRLVNKIFAYAALDPPRPPAPSSSGPTVFVIASSATGHGSDDLGTLLMRPSSIRQSNWSTDRTS
jgi:hypothetical protein